MADLPSPRLLVARGPRATEALLLEEVGRHLDAAAADPTLLARPLRLVVPSASLRQHLGAALTRQRGRGVAGLRIETHFQVAREILANAGRQARPGRWLADLLPERLARREASLAEPLEGLVDGYAAVAATVRDLLDARLEPALAEALDEALMEDGSKVASRPEVVRARALLRVAVGTWRQLEGSGLGHTSRLLVEAAELLEAEGARLLPARRVFLHGYADATGTVTDLLQALQRHLGARVYLDRPPDPRPVGAPETGDDPPPEVPPTEVAHPEVAHPEVAHPDRPHPAEAVPGPAGRFGERFVERLSQAALPEVARPEGAPSPPEGKRPTLFRARGAEGEAREVARRVAALLEAGQRPEGIALVARDPAPYRRPLRRHLEALGVPFSALGEPGSPTPEDRRIGALLDLLRRAGRTPSERWLEAIEVLPPQGSERGGGPGGPGLRPDFEPRLELRLGLAALGAGRLEEVARLDPRGALDGRPSLPLPLRLGLGEEAAEEDGEEGPDGSGGGEPREGGGSGGRPDRRSLGRPALERAVAAARRLLQRLEAWPEGTLGEHRRTLEGLMEEDLGWRRSAPGEAPASSPERAPRRRLLAALERLAAEAPDGFRLAPEELHRLLGRVLEETPGSPLGGRGGGVQVLSVTEARARTFDHLFVLGLNRGVFPRPVREDPLLQDDLRRVLERLLPDVPVKAVGFDEERYLFAQLLAAAPRVTLSWQSFDDAGDPRPPSPLVERLAPGEVPTAVSPWAPETGGGREDTPPPRPVLETLTRVALHRPRGVLRTVLPAALEEARERCARLLASQDRDTEDRDTEERDTEERDTDRRRLATARMAVLDEIDPDRSTPEGRRTARRLGPFFGFVGRSAEGDPRRRDLWVTTLERAAGCPWQTLLTRLLGLEPSPDPLRALPGLDPLLLGRVVHGVLERVVTEAAPWPSPRRRQGPPAELPELPEREPVLPPWPQPERLRGWTESVAQRVLREEGVGLPGLARALARAALPYLEAARATDWAAGAPEVLGVESPGRVEVADPRGGSRPVRFRADRVDRTAGGGLRLTDYKTGRSVSEAKREETRRRHLLAQAGEGRRLQAVAYARAELGEGGEGGGSPELEGRYLFLKPEVEQRQHAVAGTDPDFPAALERVARAVLGAWDAGAFFPRVVDPEGRREPRRCSWCPVAEACLRGDSGARLRLAAWAERRTRGGETPADEDPADEAESALLEVWWLAGERPGEGP